MFSFYLFVLKQKNNRWRKHSENQFERTKTVCFRNVNVFKVKTRWYVLLPVSINRLTPLVVHKTVIRSKERALFRV